MSGQKANYRIYGAELSPYSVKVRSYFRYKNIPHEWIVRDRSRMEEFQRYAKLPLIPLVVTPEGDGLQDSTPIIDKMEALYAAPPIHPSDPALGFLSALIEEYADEWVNKPMFHYRWLRDVDQMSAAGRLAKMALPKADAPELEAAAAAIRERMVSRLSFVGSSPETADQIEASFKRLIDLVERHLGDRDYLFGGRPAFADFGLYAQLYEMWSDPTPGALIKESCPRLVRWIERMLDPPRGGGDFESWDRLAPTLAPILSQEIAGLFLPWSVANARALEAGEAAFSVELEGRAFRQGTQKYHARSLKALRARYQSVLDKTALDPILRETACLEWLG